MTELQWGFVVTPREQSTIETVVGVTLIKVSESWWPWERWSVDPGENEGIRSTLQRRTNTLLRYEGETGEMKRFGYSCFKWDSVILKMELECLDLFGERCLCFLGIWQFSFYRNWKYVACVEHFTLVLTCLWPEEKQSLRALTIWCHVE